MRKRIRYSSYIVLLTGLLWGVYYLNSLLPIATGYPAKYLASAVFISGRDAGEVEALDLNFSLIRYVKNTIDTAGKKVVSTLLWGKSTAIYREGFGCTLLRNTSEAVLRSVRFPEGTAAPYDQDTLDWPLGNVLPAGETGADKVALAGIARKLIEEDAYSGHAFAFLVLHKGVPVVERYRDGFNARTRFLSWSMAKSFTSALAGMMVKDGLIHVDKPAGIPEWADDERSRISIADLLQMQSGLKWNEDYGNRSDVTKMLYCNSDMAAYTYRRPAEFPAGSHWYYSSGSTNVVSYLMRKASGSDSSFYSYVKTNFFNRLGMPDAVFEPDASGTLVGSSYIYATARDYARFALLYLQNGKFNGKQLLPEDWVHFSSSPASGSGGQYGAGFWLNRSKSLPSAPANMFFCNGHDGQRIFIMPDQQLAVVVLSYSPGPDHALAFNELLNDVLKATTGGQQSKN